MSRLADIANQILRRGVELMVESNYRLTFDQAQRKAAKQIATIEKLKPRPVTRKRSSIDDGFERDDPRRILIQKVNALRRRLKEQLTREPVPDAFSSKTLGDPTPEPEKSVLSRLIGFGTGSNSDDTPENPDGPAQTYAQAGLLMGICFGGGSRAELINYEFDSDPRYHDDQTTANWRRSIEANERRRNQPPSGEFKF